MRIMFINFNLGSTPGINNGLAILSSILKNGGHETGAIFLSEEMGYDFDLRRIEKDITVFRPDVIGFSFMEPQFKYAQALARDVRRYYDGMLICGGPHPTMDPEGALSADGVDVVCVGEGEDAMLELVERMSRGEECTDIRNLWFKRGRGEPIKNRLRPFKDISFLPPEDKEIFDLKTLLPLKNYQLEVSVGRGCAYKCSYCINDTYLGRYKELCDGRIGAKDYIRLKNADTTIAEIRNVVRKHPEVRKISFIDDNLLSYPGFAEGFFRKYKDEIGLPFMCNANPLSFNSKTARLLKDAGCDDVRFGLESGSERVKRDVMNRPMSNKRVSEAFRYARDGGLMTSSFNMIGLPTETAEEVMDTMRLNADIAPDTVKVMTFYPFKNTPIYELCREGGLIDHGRKDALDNYDTSTCLKFSAPHRLFLEKVQVAFNWYINSLLDTDAAPFYKKAVDEIDGMDRAVWRKFDFDEADKELSEKMKKRNFQHYVKFCNRSLAVKSTSKHLR